jgi:outer membrane protein assembly factor BamB
LNLNDAVTSGTGEIMLGKTAAVLVLAVSCAATGITPSLAAGGAGQAVSENSPWYQTDFGAALSRANLAEHVLTPSTVSKVGYLRSVVAPPTPPEASCSEPVVAPALVGGYLYVMTGGKLSKYNAATGKLIWRRTPDPTFDTDYTSLSVSSSGLVVVGGGLCDSESEPGSAFYAYNASTGALVWSASPSEGLNQSVVSNGYVLTAGIDAAGYFFYVLNLSNGKTVWESTNGCMPSPWTPLVVSSLAMLYGCDSAGNTTIEARQLGTGSLVWQLAGRWTLQRGASNAKQLFATNPTGTVVALNPLTGQDEYSLNGAIDVLAVDNSRAYATCGSQGEYVCAYDVSTGTLEWQDTQLIPLFDFATLAAEAGGVLYLNTGAALNAATGNLIKALPFDSNSLATALAVGDGRIAAVSDPRVLDLFGLPGY